MVWKYQKLVLGKMKNPYWDWKGEKRLFKFDDLGVKAEPNEEEIRQSLFGDIDLGQETIFHNHFSDPRKPYIFLNYDLWGDHPLDETTRIEQVRLTLI